MSRSARVRCLVIVLLIALGMSVAPHPARADDPPPGTWQIFIGDETLPGRFDYPVDAVVDSHGNLYVLETSNFRIQKVSPDGKTLALWGSEGKGPGQFSRHSGDGHNGLALDRQGNVYFTDGQNSRIQKLSPEGEFLAEWGSPGDGPRQFRSPSGLKVDGEGNIYVADTGNDRIVKLSPDGEPLALWGPKRGGHWGEFFKPEGLALDSGGNVYVADTGNDRIAKLSPDGEWLAQWGKLNRDGTTSSGSDPGEFTWPSSVAVDADGNIYVAEELNDRIQKLSPSGEPLGLWGRKGYGPGEYAFLQAVTVDDQGNVYGVDGMVGRVQKHTPDGRVVAQWGSNLDASSPFHPNGLAIDSRGMLYVADGTEEEQFRDSARIQVFSPEGEQLAVFGRAGEAPGRFSIPRAVAVDDQGYIYVADTGNHRVQKLSPSGEVVARWGEQGRAPGQFGAPSGIAVDHEGNVYVADSGNYRVQKLSPEGVPLAEWVTQNPRDGKAGYPESLTIDGQGNVYVAYWGWIQKFSPDGETLARWGSPGQGSGQLSAPLTLAVDREGNLYVAETQSNRIQKLSPDGEFLAQWGSYGYGVGQFSSPAGIAVDARGNVYVSDRRSNRIQRLLVDGTPATEGAS
jgi:DNA-binding beta-propeller fold protein YncE